MEPKNKVEILPSVLRRCDTTAFDAFHENRLRQDMAEFSEAPGVLEQCFQRARIRFRKAGERAILGHWEELYRAGERLIAARVAMERQKSEHLQLSREHEAKETEKSTNLAKLQADLEEHNLRRDRAGYQRQHLERSVEAGSNLNISENERKHAEAHERRQLDNRWEVHESLRSLQTLIELQRWRRQQRDSILKDRSLTAEEQGEDLQFVDDLYQQKRAELKVDTRIFEGE